MLPILTKITSLVLNQDSSHSRTEQVCVYVLHGYTVLKVAINGIQNN